MKSVKLGFWMVYIIFAASIINCEMDNESEWEQVNSMNDIAGTWENSFTMNVSATGDYNDTFASIFEMPIPATSVFYENYQFKYIENDTAFLVKTKIVYNKLLNDVIKLNKEYTKDALWNNLVKKFEPVKDTLNMTIEKYYVIFEDQNLVNDTDFSALYLHQDKKRLKMILPLSETYKQEVILYKQ